MKVLLLCLIVALAFSKSGKEYQAYEGYDKMYLSECDKGVDVCYWSECTYDDFYGIYDGLAKNPKSSLS